MKLMCSQVLLDLTFSKVGLNCIQDKKLKIKQLAFVQLLVRRLYFLGFVVEKVFHHSKYFLSSVGLGATEKKFLKS